MEKVLINEVVKKGKIWLVNYGNNQKASIAPWGQELADKLSGYVGKYVMLKLEKNGDYMNVIDMEEGGQTPNFEVTQDTPKSMLLTNKDEVIIGQVILKEASNMLNALIVSGTEIDSELSYDKILVENVQMLTAAYKVALTELRK